jgi:leader peptidase (prepilin peptidase)/N-methyltransferase
VAVPGRRDDRRWYAPPVSVVTARTVLVIGISGLVGLIIGSFLNVVIYRLPRGESIVQPGSRCPSCGTSLRATDNVPLLSWVLLRGRCRTCGTSISARYPLVEGATGAAFAVTAAAVGPHGELPCLLVVEAAAIAAAAIDLDGFRVPWAVAIAGAVGAAGLAGALGAHGSWARLAWGAAGAAAAVVVSWAGSALAGTGPETGAAPDRRPDLRPSPGWLAIAAELGFATAAAWWVTGIAFVACCVAVSLAARRIPRGRLLVVGAAGFVALVTGSAVTHL